jgi:hypothetical protein
MSYSEDEIKKSAELKQWIEAKVLELENEIAKLKDATSIIDSILRKTSFRTASEITPPSIKKEIVEKVLEKEVESGVRQLRSNEGFLLGNGVVTSSSITIIPVKNLKLDIATPPFKSFFINRILTGMKKRDNESVAKGEIKEDQVLAYGIEEEEEEGIIKKITIKNYRDNNRLNEIVKTISWAFTRMLEKRKPKE